MYSVVEWKEFQSQKKMYNKYDIPIAVYCHERKFFMKHESKWFNLCLIYTAYQMKSSDNV